MEASLFVIIKMNYFHEELIEMIYILGESERNSFLASRLYAQRYPDRRHPKPEAFESVKERFERTGSIKYEKKERTKPITGEENEIMVLTSIVEDPHTSTRKVSRQLNISQTSVSRVIRKHKFHPYHIKLAQELDEGDFQNRLNFCQWAVDKSAEQPEFLNFVLFTDEATFHKNGYVNRHNFHYYDTQNPHIIRPANFQNRWSLNVWGGIVGSCILGPYFFDGNVNGEEYLRFLRTDFQNFLENLPLNIIGRMWFQHDGAPAHYSHQVREYLDQDHQFQNKWIGRGGPVPWPARSPDLTKLDFFLWGYVKELVYQTVPTTKEDMKIRIRNAFTRITQNVLHNVSTSLENRIRTCIVQNGGYIEHIL